MKPSNTKRITLLDIAEKACFSKSTVSMALKNSPLIAKETCARIQSVAREMGYNPDPVLSHMASMRRQKKSPARSHTIAFVLQATKKIPSFLTRLVSGIRLAANTLGYKLEIHFPGNYTSSQHLSTTLYHRGIQGVLLGPILSPETPLILDWDHFSIVNCTCGINQPPAVTVTANMLLTVQLAWDKMAALGKKRIGLLLWDTGYPVNDNIPELGGFLVRQYEASPDFAKIPPFFYQGNPDTSANLPKSSLKKWLSTHQPDAIIGAIDTTAKWLTQAGVAIPDECAFLCLNKENPRSPVAGFSLHHEDIGKKSLEQLNLLLQTQERGLSANPIEILLPPEWHPGPSMR